MSKKKRIRTSLIPPNKRVRIEQCSCSVMNVTNKIRVQGGLIGKLLGDIAKYRESQKNYFKR